MGNLQAGEAKPAKGVKAKGRLKIRGRKGKPADDGFAGVVPDDDDDDKEEERHHVDGGKHEEVVEERKKPADGFRVRTPEIKTQQLLPELTPISSSSDSNFTDALTPIGCSTEINQYRYSEESVDDVEVPNSTQENFLALNSFKLNEYRARHEQDKTRKLGKLGLSRTSQISLESDPAECFATDNVEAVVRGDGNATDVKNDSWMADSGYGAHEDISGGGGASDEDGGTLKRRRGQEGPQAVQVGDATQTVANGHPCYARHMSVPLDLSDVRLTSSDSLVSQKVASFTFSRGDLESKISKPKFVPEKLDFKLYEKFEGHMLVNWYLSEFSADHHVAQVNSDLKLIALQFCTHLLAAGVLKQLQDKDVPMYNIFKPDCMYYWSHAEVPASVSQTPGRLSTASWPPISPSDCLSPASEGGFSPPAPAPEDMVSPAPELRRSARDVEILAYEEEIRTLRQDLEKLRTLVEIQNLTAKTVQDFSSPDDETKGCDFVRKGNTRDFAMQADITSDNVYNFVTASTQTEVEEMPSIAQEIQRETPKEIAQSTRGIVLSISAQSDSVQLSPSMQVPVPSPPPPMPGAFVPPPPPPPPMPMMGAPPPPPLPGGISPPPPMGGAPLPPPLPGMGPPPPPMPGMGPPPPPMPGMGPPPPPMPGMGPPPPPMPGMGPPPPPMPGMGPPPPPMPGMGPPPPPMPGMGPPPPPMPGMGPPAPPMPGIGPPPPPMPGGGPPPPPPPSFVGGGPPPPPPLGGPVPMPAPPPGGWNPQKAVAQPAPPHLAIKKPALTPSAPMKPLYWTRIIAPLDKDITDKGDNSALWDQIDEIPLDNIGEFTNLFSRQVVKKVSSIRKLEQKPKVEAVKLLDSKRSQNVGILAQSLKVDFQEIENAIYNFDTSIVSLEALQQIYEVRATTEELELIKNHLNAKPDVPLDKPEQFLHDLSEMSNFAERISCLMFQVEFDDAINTIGHNLTNVKSTCEYLINSPELKKLMAIILTFGNYMNGGNMSRGQADGFGLEILSKLRDVKSNDSKTTLLHFVVRTYMRTIENPFECGLTLPVPEPGDVRRAASVNFDDLKADLQKLQKQLDQCERKTQKIIENSTPENVQPFKDKMTAFLENSKKQLTSEFENLEGCHKQFIATMKFYLFKPKTGTLETFAPNSFFELWLSFCVDFKDIFKKELIRLEKEKVDELRRKENERVSEGIKIKERENGLKAKIKRIKATQFI